MELRKLQKTGGTTYVVSLPKNWIVRENLDQSSVVSIEEQRDGALLVSPKTEEKKELKEAELDASQNLYRKLIANYLLGYDTLKIKSHEKLSKELKQTIKGALQKLIGFEIMEETANTITIQNLLDPAEVSILKSLRRMYTIVSVMHKDLISAAEESNPDLLKDVIQRDSEVNRLYFLVVRQIRTVIQKPRLLDKENIKAVDCVDYRLVAKIIETIGDQLEDLAKALENRRLKPKELKLLKTSYEIHNKAATALFTKDEQLATEARDIRLTLEEKHSPVSAEILKIADSGKDLADIVVSE